MLAKIEAELADLEYDLKMEKAKLRALHAPKFKNKWQLDDEIDVDLEDQIARVNQLEIRRGLTEGVVKGYDDLARAASREMTRRIGEITAKD